MAFVSKRIVLSTERLEARDLPSGSYSVLDAFQQASSSGLPTGWSSWSADAARGRFAVEPNAAGLGDSGRLASNGASGVSSRAWVTTPAPADVEASVSLYLDSLVAVPLVVRGRELGTSAASYYGVSVVRGGQVALSKVIRGQETVLGRVASREWVSGRWVHVALRVEGSVLSAFVIRTDTNQYLTPDGTWSRQPVAVIEKADRDLAGTGFVGFVRPAGQAAGTVALDSFRIGPVLRADWVVEERFDNGPSNGLPTGWGSWSNAANRVTFRTSDDATLRIDGDSVGVARIFRSDVSRSDVQLSSSLFVDSLTPAGLFVRGRNLGTATPTYYGLTVTRGLDIRLVRVVDGREMELSRLRSREWVSGVWLQVSLIAKGPELRVQVYRSDTGQYLLADGSWALAPVFAMARADLGIAAAGSVGLSRGSGAASSLQIDNVLVGSAPATLVPAPIPTERDKPTTPTPPPIDLPPPSPPPPPPVVSPPAPLPGPIVPGSLPAVPRNYDWIRLANLAYHGTPMTGFEQSLIRNSIDLIVPNPVFLNTIATTNPDTPQLIYTNVSNIYLNLLTDWLSYADRMRLNREQAFYHVTQASPFNGMSASAVPVSRFWSVLKGSDGNWADLTGAARDPSSTFAMPSNGQSLAIGSLEKFREVNVDLNSFAAGSWSSVLEYVSAVDSTGRPTAWSPLRLIGDTTRQFRSDGTLTFDPPANWKPAVINGSASLFYIRVRVNGVGTVPIVNSIRGRDFTNSADRDRGTIPAFDLSADRDRDGYLNDAEWALRRPGYNARFLYESRLFYPNYGPNRFATNVADPGFRAWAVDYHRRIATATPLARGFFVDNSIGRLAVDPLTIRESLTGYDEQYGALLGAVQRGLPAGRWLLANTAGAGRSAEPIARNGVSFLEEFALRPLAANTVQFEDLAALLQSRRQLSNRTAYEVLDSLPTVLDATDPRMQITTLAMYYLLADPDLTMLMLNGGNEPNSSWQRHWTDAATVDVGRPTESWRVLASGFDPANRTLAYKVYARNYSNALVLYKPLSYTRGVNGTTANNTATVHELGGSYRPVQADGSIGAPITRISLRNGEGSILVRSR